MQKKNPHERANELHNLIADERKRRHTTTAVGNTAEELKNGAYKTTLYK